MEQSIEKKKVRKQDVATKAQLEQYARFKAKVGHGWSRTIIEACKEDFDKTYSRTFVRWVAQGIRSNEHIEAKIIELLKLANKPKDKSDFEKQLENLL